MKILGYSVVGSAFAGFLLIATAEASLPPQGATALLVSDLGQAVGTVSVPRSDFPESVQPVPGMVLPGQQYPALVLMHFPYQEGKHPVHAMLRGIRSFQRYGKYHTAVQGSEDYDLTHGNTMDHMRAVLRNPSEWANLREILSATGAIPVTIYDGRATLLVDHRHPAIPGEGLATVYREVPNWIIRLGTPAKYVDFLYLTSYRIGGRFSAAHFPEVKVDYAFNQPATANSWLQQALDEVARGRGWLLNTLTSLQKPERIPGGYRVTTSWVGFGPGPSGKAKCDLRAERTRVDLGSGFQVASDCFLQSGNQPGSPGEWRQRIQAYFPDALAHASQDPLPFQVDRPSALFPKGCRQFLTEQGYPEYGYALYFTGSPGESLSLKVTCIAEGVTLRHDGRVNRRELTTLSLRAD